MDVKKATKWPSQNNYMNFNVYDKLYFIFSHTSPIEAYKKLHACLHCIHVACQAHRNNHSIKKSHPLSVELIYGNVYCAECNDYVYDLEFETVSDAFTWRASKSLGRGLRYEFIHG